MLALSSSCKFSANDLTHMRVDYYFSFYPCKTHLQANGHEPQVRDERAKHDYTVSAERMTVHGFPTFLA